MRKHTLAKRRDRRKAERLLKIGVVREPHRNERLKGHHTHSKVSDQGVRVLPPVKGRGHKGEHIEAPRFGATLAELLGVSGGEQGLEESGPTFEESRE